MHALTDPIEEAREHVATAQPGSVRVGLYDPRRLGAGLGGFHTLSRSGLLTVYGIKELKDLLGSLNREIRRIQREEVLPPTTPPPIGPTWTRGRGDGNGRDQH